MKVHIIDETKSSQESLKPLCRKLLINENSKQFLTHATNIHLVDCKDCLKIHQGKL